MRVKARRDVAEPHPYTGIYESSFQELNEGRTDALSSRIRTDCDQIEFAVLIKDRAKTQRVSRQDRHDSDLSSAGQRGPEEFTGVTAILRHRHVIGLVTPRCPRNGVGCNPRNGLLEKRLNSVKFDTRGDNGDRHLCNLHSPDHGGGQLSGVAPVVDYIERFLRRR
jgi:hypothetical protein